MEEKKPRIKILVACHKADPNIRQDDIYMPIQVGKALHPELDLGFQCDNTGDNISEKNATYCELTALYWAWKNLPNDIEYVGLAHYRRYLRLTERALNALKKGIVLFPTYEIYRWNVFHSISNFTTYEDSIIFINSILEILPDSKDSIIQYYYNNNKQSKCNMFIMPRNKFDEYCTYLFEICMRFESVYKPSNYTRQKRVIGYLTEAFLGFWIRYKHLKSLQLSIVGHDPNSFRTDMTNIKNNMLYIAGNLTGHRIQQIPLDQAVMNGLKTDNIFLNALEN